MCAHVFFSDRAPEAQLMAPAVYAPPAAAAAQPGLVCTAPGVFLGSNTLFFSAASPASNTALPIRPSDGGVCTSSNTGKVTPCCASGSRGPVRESSLYGRLRCGYIRNSSARLDLDNDTSWPTEICGEEPRREGRARPTGVRGIRADANQPEYAAPSTQSQSIVSLAACMWANCHGPCWAL